MTAEEFQTALAGRARRSQLAVATGNYLVGVLRAMEGLGVPFQLAPAGDDLVLRFDKASFCKSAIVVRGERDLIEAAGDIVDGFLRTCRAVGVMVWEEDGGDHLTYRFPLAYFLPDRRAS